MSWTDCLLSPVSCGARKAGSAAAESAWESFLKWSAQGLSDLSMSVFNKMSTSTSPRFDQQWWRDNLEIIAMVSLPVLVGMFVVQCLAAVVRREPGYLGRAWIGAAVGTAGVPISVGVVASLGHVADEISLVILDSPATASGYRRMTDISAALTAGTAGGYLLMAVALGLIAMFALYFVMLLREVALLAFVVFAPIALVSWTWTATRHWLRRWTEVVAALLFSKVAMAAVFTLGVSATGAGKQGGGSTLGTFLAGVLLVGLAAFTPMLTFSFIHWAGDQTSMAAHSMQQSSRGVESARDHAQGVQDWKADHFGSTQDTGDDVVGEKDGKAALGDESSPDSQSNEAARMASGDGSAFGQAGEDKGNSPSAAPTAVATATATANGRRDDGSDAASDAPEAEGRRDRQPEDSRE